MCLIHKWTKWITQGPLVNVDNEKIGLWMVKECTKCGVKRIKKVK